MQTKYKWAKNKSSYKSVHFLQPCSDFTNNLNILSVHSDEVRMKGESRARAWSSTMWSLGKRLQEPLRYKNDVHVVKVRGRPYQWPWSPCKTQRTWRSLQWQLEEKHNWVDYVHCTRYLLTLICNEIVFFLRLIFYCNSANHKKTKACQDFMQYKITEP